MRHNRPKDQKGQSAVEFVLAAPFLFMLLFCVIQMVYTGLVSFAVQRASLSIARTAALSGPDNNLAFKTQLVLSLLPLSNLDRKTLLTILESDVHVSISADRKQVTTQVRYPMLIWVPLADRIFGEELTPALDYNNSVEGQAIKNVFAFLKKPLPNLSFDGIRPLVCWVAFEETTFNEGFKVIE